MAIKTTRWRPDTCDCVLEYEWDDTTNENDRVHTFARHIHVCTQHTGLNGEPVYTNVLSENVRKNRIGGEFLDRLGAVLGEIDAESGGVVWKRGITFNWYWIGTGTDRVLHVYITGYTLTAQQKALVQNRADILFGAGKVVVD